MVQPTTLGSYAVERELGRGGMGVVYLARDPRLNRLVALKVLSGELGRHPDHLARFEREAKHLAALNHPNIAAIYGVEDVETAGSGDTPAERQRLLVLEYVPGDTLAQRLKFGSLPTSEALEFCRQIALALEAAHDNGVIHRDLKPGNVAITPDGQVKVLDFGLAKGGAASASDVDLALSPTFTYTPTAMGVILGTAAYMSPEQARGKPVDKRTDIWAFGCVLFECLTGRQFFQGETVSDTIARILERDPDWSLLPADTPPKVRELLRRCLEKDVKKRQRDIGDVRIELEEAIAARSSSARAATSDDGRAARRRSLSPMLITAGGLLVGALIGIGLWTAFAARGSGVTPSGPTRLSVTFPSNIRVVDAGIMPDGATVLISGFVRNPDGTEEQRSRLFTRRLDSYDFKPIPGTEDVVNVAPSPDGRWLAFVSRVSEQTAQRRVSKVPTDGSAPPVVLADWNDAWNTRIVWLEDGDLLIPARAGDEASLFRLPTGGGPPKPSMKIDTGTAAVFPGFVNALPGGKGVFAQFTSWGPQGYQQDVWLLDVQTGKASLLFENAGNPVYVPTGHVVFSRNDTLQAAPFDLATMSKGDVVGLTGGIRAWNSWEPGRFTVSRNGVLMYAHGQRIGTDRQLVVVDAAGTMTPFVTDRRSYETPPEISPDGRKAAVVVANERGTYEIWIAERGRSTVRAIAIPNADASSPVWSPDGQRLAYSRQALASDDGVYIERVDGGEPAKLLIKHDSQQVFITPVSWARDGSGIIVERDEAGKQRLFFIPLAGGEPGTPRPLRGTRYNEGAADFSPDGRMVTFIAEDSGRPELYVATYRNGALGPAIQVSRDLCGGVEWSADSRRLFFCDLAEKLVSVSVRPEPLSVSAPVQVLDFRKLRLANWDLMPDGNVLGLLKGDGEEDLASMHVVLNWFDELRSRMQR